MPTAVRRRIREAVGRRVTFRAVANQRGDSGGNMAGLATGVRQHRIGTSIAVIIAVVGTTLMAFVGVAAAASPPGPPTGVTATAGVGQATVSWTAPTDLGGGLINAYIVTPFVGYAPQPPTIFHSAATTETVTGLTNGWTYRFKVQASNASPIAVGTGTGPPSRASNPVIPATVPDAPTIGIATAGVAEATVSWTAPAFDGGSPISGYVVTPFVDGVAQTPATFDSTATTQTVTGLANDTSYRFRVQAINAVGTGGQSGESNSVGASLPVPDAPTIGTATGGIGQATVSWSAPASDGGSPIIGYEVTTYLGTVAQPAILFNDTSTTQTITGLTNGVPYNF